MRLRWYRSRILWAAAGLVVALTVFSAVTAIQMISTYRDVVEARELLLSAEAGLRQDGLDPSPDSLSRSELQATLARDKFRSAREFLNGAPLLRVAGWIPGIDSHISAAENLADIGYEGSEIGLTGVAAVRALDDVETREDAALGENVLAYLEATRPMMVDAETRLATIREKRDSIDTGWLLPPLSDLVTQFDEQLLRVEEAIDQYRHGRAVADHVLGARGRTRYLVLGLDNTELLPGGGLIGVYGLITFDNGRVVERTFGEVQELIVAWQERTGGEYIEPPGALKRYLLRDWTWSFPVSNWSPDFPTSARQALFFYERSGAEPGDGVIALDFIALERLLAVLGATEIADYAVTINAANVTEEILARIGRPLRPQDGDHAFAAAVATGIVDRALVAGRGEWVPLLAALDGLTEEKHLFLYVGEGRIQSSVRELGWAGEVRDASGDYLMTVNASVHSSKLNLVLQERIALRVHLNGDGSVRNTVVLTYENPLADWERSRDSERLAGLMLSGLYGGYIRLLAPPQALLLDLQLDGRSVGAEEVTREANKASFGRYLPLPRDTAAALTFTYSVPAAIGVSRGTHEYRLLIQKQAGTRAAPLAIEFVLPEGERARAVSLNGERLTGAPMHFQTELSRDLDLTVVY